jgi:hypothetical protein
MTTILHDDVAFIFQHNLVNRLLLHIQTHVHDELPEKMRKNAQYSPRTQAKEITISGVASQHHVCLQRSI